jgi:hypothetical protein
MTIIKNEKSNKKEVMRRNIRCPNNNHLTRILVENGLYCSLNSGCYATITQIFLGVFNG